MARWWGQRDCRGLFVASAFVLWVILSLGEKGEGFVGGGLVAVGRSRSRGSGTGRRELQARSQKPQQQRRQRQRQLDRAHADDYADLSFLDMEKPGLLSTEDLLDFERKGHIFTSGLFTLDEMTILAPLIESAFRKHELAALRQKVSVFFGEDVATSEACNTADRCLELLHQLPPEDIPFLQVFNLWRKEKVIERLVKSRRIASAAAQLLGTKAVRLYQDSSFLKRPGDGCTNWHSDLAMTPLDMNHLVTCWIPTSPVPKEESGGTGLIFASGSHRDFALGFWNDERADDLGNRYEESSHPAFRVGDVGWHHGWVLHSAPGNSRETARLAFTASYTLPTVRLVGEDAHSPDDEDAWSYREWREQASEGLLITGDHPYLPVIHVC